MVNGISRLIAVAQLKGENANDEALRGKSKQATPKQTSEPGFAHQTPSQSLGNNQMFEMYSKTIANAHEMKKALIGNFPR